MKKRISITLLLSALISTTLFADNVTIKESEITLTTTTGELKGILREPTNPTKTAVIILSGAARTDRDGNQPQTKNNSLKMLAEALTKEDIAVFNFDKRGVGQSQRAGTDEAKVTLDTYVADAKDWITLLKEQKAFENIIVIGHGEGSLIGMMASTKNPLVSKFISIGGTSRKASEATKAQFANQPANIKNVVYENIDKLEKGERIERVPQEWSVLFRSGLQPYLISLYRHNPTEEISKLTIPTLIIQGDKDVQASVEDAEHLAKSNTKANKVIIENMNYVLKECDKIGHQNQLNTYLKPNFPLNKDLVPSITNFIFEKKEEIAQ